MAGMARFSMTRNWFGKVPDCVVMQDSHALAFAARYRARAGFGSRKEKPRVTTCDTGFFIFVHCPAFRVWSPEYRRGSPEADVPLVVELEIHDVVLEVD
jgi:hypothetical protein